jgi:hypothetical protein
MQGVSFEFVAALSQRDDSCCVEFTHPARKACFFGNATRTFAGLASLVLMLVAGCSYRANRVSPVDIDPSSAASAAIELYDKDSDDALAGAELNAAPGIKKYLDRYDRDGDGRVMRAEIAERLREWTNSKLALMGRSYIVTLDGRPLEDATITLVPEGYLGENVKPATGITSTGGLTRLSHAEEFLPKSSNGRPIPGVKSGTYKIQVTHSSMKIPAKYNTATELGDEVAPDINPNDSPMALVLTTK